MRRLMAVAFAVLCWNLHAGWVLKQRTLDDGKTSTRMTAYYEENRYRIDTDAGQFQNIIIFDGKSYWSCNGQDKTCLKDFRGMFGVREGMEVRFEKYEVTATGKTSSVLGHPCKEFKVDIEMASSMMGMQHSTKTSSTSCNATEMNLTGLFKAMLGQMSQVKPFVGTEKIAKEFMKHKSLGPDLAGQTTIFGVGGENKFTHVTDSIVDKPLDPKLFTLPPGYKLSDGKELAMQQREAMKRAAAAQKEMQKHFKGMTKEQKEMLKKMGVPVPGVESR